MCAGKPVSRLFSRGTDGADDGDGRSLMSLTSAREAAPSGFVGLDVSVSSSDDRSISNRWPRMIALKSMLDSPAMYYQTWIFIYGCLKFLVECGSAEIAVVPYISTSEHLCSTIYDHTPKYSSYQTN